MKHKLSEAMSVSEFDNGYWYVDELKRFAKTLSIPSPSKLRKDELEKEIRFFLRNGILSCHTRPKTVFKGEKDSEHGLSKNQFVRNYTNNRETKNFIVSEAKKLVPDLKEKSGVRYRLNRWREAQIASDLKITYGDLINHYIVLNKTEGKFSQIPHGRYINFLSDYMSNEELPKKNEALTAWEELKLLDIPKSYDAWKKHKGKAG